MSEETKQGDSSEQLSGGGPDLNSLIEESPVLTPQPEAEKPEPKKEEPKEKSAEESEPAEKPTEDSKPSETKDPAEGEEPVTEEKVSVPSELTEEQKLWKKAYENQSKWQRTLTQKSQLVNELSDDDVRNIQAEIKLRKELEKVSPEPLPEYIEEEYTDELGDKHVQRIPSSKLQKLIDQKVAEARNAWVKEKAVELAKGEQAIAEARQTAQYAEANTVVTGIKAYFKDFPDASFDLGADPVQTLKDIQEAGTIHPDYDKFLNMIQVADRSKAKNISMEQAHIELFGKSSRERKAKEKIREEQQRAPEERPGQVPKTPTEDEEFERSLGIGVKSDGIFQYDK